MALKIPTSMEECLYFTNRSLDGEFEGQVLAWVYRKLCPKCKKDNMGKPINPKTDQPKTRAKEYVCPSCGYEEAKSEHEASLTLEAKYTCPHCGKEGESSCPYVRKTFQGVKAFVIECSECGEKIALTKKMKEPKKKKPKKKKS